MVRLFLPVSKGRNEMCLTFSDRSVMVCDRVFLEKYKTVQNLGDISENLFQESNKAS